MTRKSNDADNQQIVLNQDPLVAGVPLRSLNGTTTPAGQFFVRNHFAIPTIDAFGWNLKVDGQVETPQSLTYQDIKELPKRITEPGDSGSAGMRRKQSGFSAALN